MSNTAKNLSAMRNDLETVRAMGMMVMVTFHWFPHILPGAYAVIDVFFVLSGYVVTQNLLSTVQKSGSVWEGMLDFWARRCKRLLPNALLVIVCAMIVAWLFLGPIAIRQAASDFIWATGFAANWQFVREVHDYFAASSPLPRLTTHYWSLAVEEQFYITWPLLMAGLGLYATSLSDVQLKHRLRILLVLAFFSFVLAVYQTDRDLRQAYYDTMVRIWEFLCGGILAFRRTAIFSGAAHWSRSARLSTESAAVLAIGVAAIFFDPHSSLRAWSILVAAAATMVLIEVGRDGPPVLAILRNRILVAVGRRSYSMYLWHWPVLIFAKHFFDGDSLVVLGLAFLVSMVLAQLGWRYVEVPARYHLARNWSSKKVLFFAALTIGLIISFPFAMRASDGAGFQVMRANVAKAMNLAPALVTQRDRPSIYKNGCHLTNGETEPLPCRFGDTESKNTVVLFGNSLAAQWFSPLESAAKTEGFALVNMTKSSCPVLDVPHAYSASKRSFAECENWVERSLQLIERQKPQWVIVSGIEPLSPHVLQRHGSRSETALSMQTQPWSQSLERVLRRIQNAGATPIMIRHTPSHRTDVLDCLYIQGAAACTAQLPPQRSSGYWDLEVANKLNVEVWDFNADICPQGLCQAYRADLGVVTYSDSDHLTDSFVRQLAPQVLAKWKSSLVAR